ncbi:MAG: hypothetical protein ACFFBD_18220 [Candidatus Hodarchaeota archaeon]
MIKRKIRKLTPEELQILTSQLMNRFLSSIHCERGNPFQENEFQVIFEEFFLWRKSFFDRLIRVLNLKHQSTFNILRYQSQESDFITFLNGYKANADLSFQDYKKLGSNIGFTINGFQFFLCDDSISWTIGTVVDVQFLSGDDDFFNFYFVSETEKKKTIKEFIMFIDRDDVRPNFRKMVTYIRRKP